MALPGRAGRAIRKKRSWPVSGQDGERLIPAGRLLVRPRAAGRAVQRLDVPKTQRIWVAALLCQSGPALAIFEPGSACGMPYAPLHRRRAVGPPR